MFVGMVLVGCYWIVLPPPTPDVFYKIRGFRAALIDVADTCSVFELCWVGSESHLDYRLIYADLFAVGENSL